MFFLLNRRSEIKHQENIRILRERFGYIPTDAMNKLAVAGAVRHFTLKEAGLA